MNRNVILVGDGPVSGEVDFAAAQVPGLQESFLSRASMARDPRGEGRLGAVVYRA